MWTQNSLKKFLGENFKDYETVIVANREPYSHIYDKDNKVTYRKNVGGVSITFDVVMKTTKGTWVAYGDGSADKDVTGKDNSIKVPPEDPVYKLKRVWLTKSEYANYYEGFANQSLWPMCHIAFVKPHYDEKYWEGYKKVNKKFADSVLEEIKGKKAIVWIQDYHFALLSKYIKKKRPDVIVAQFWHIPWPTYEIFRTCPWAEEILDGMLNNDLIGFHRNYQAINFMEDVARYLEANVNREEMTVTYHNHKTKVGYFPISVDYARLKSKSERTKTRKNHLVNFDCDILALGVDRIDYTKGIPNRLKAIERFLDKNPKYIGKFVYLGIGSPSRTGIDDYQRVAMKIKQEVKRINEKFRKKNWQPIVYHDKTVQEDDLLYLYKNADICLVTPLDDGMNLVCKEYVSVNKGNGALVLSSFIGAANELRDAYMVNPYDTKMTSDAIKHAIEDKDSVKKEKMKKMKAIVEENNVYKWVAKYFKALINAKDRIEEAS